MLGSTTLFARQGGKIALTFVIAMCLGLYQPVIGGVLSLASSRAFVARGLTTFAASPNVQLATSQKLGNYKSHRCRRHGAEGFGAKANRKARLNSVLQLRSSGEHGDSSESSAVLCRKLTTSFRKVWLSLYSTGMDEEYMGSLGCFVDDAVAAYDEGYSISALLLELNMNELVFSRDRMDRSECLTDEERRTREVWLFLVYSTLARLRYIPKTGFITATPEDKIGLQPLVEFTCAAMEEGFSLDGLHLEMALRQADDPLTPAQLSLRAQWIRIIFLTHDAMRARKAST